MAHKHPIYDTDPHFTIDPITRKIVNQTEGKTKLIQFDHNSERFTFDIPRLVDGHDMSLCDKVEIHYINISTSGTQQNADVYPVEDVTTNEETDEVCFSWLISQNATQIIGSLNFLIKFICLDGEEITYRWNTDIFKDIMISDGINNAESVVTENSDVLEAWKSEVLADVLPAVEEAKVAAEEAKSEAGKAAASALSAESSARNASNIVMSATQAVGRASQEADRAEIAADNAENAVMEYIPKVQSRNLIPTNFQNGRISDVYGFLENTTGFANAGSPDFIPVVGGVSYTFSWINGYNACTFYVFEYAEDKTYINKTSLAGMRDSLSPYTLIFNENCKYIRICIETWLSDIPWETLLPDNFQFEQGDTATEYIEPKVIDQKFIDYSALMAIAVKSDHLYGKKLVACGDSITDAYDLEANNGSRIKSYAEITADRHSMIFAKNAISGSTMAYNVGGNAPISTSAFSNTRYLDLPEFDYLTLWFGWNDAAYSQLGTINDEDNTTFYGAYKKVLDYLITNNPTKKIGIVVPYGGSNVEPFAQAVRDISKMYGVPCLDLRDYNECSAFWEKTDGNPAIVARRDAMTFDTTHPNKAGHEFLSTIYDAFIKRL